MQHKSLGYHVFYIKNSIRAASDAIENQEWPRIQFSNTDHFGILSDPPNSSKRLSLLGNAPLGFGLNNSWSWADTEREVITDPVGRLSEPDWTKTDPFRSPTQTIFFSNCTPSFPNKLVLSQVFLTRRKKQSHLGFFIGVLESWSA